MASGRPLMFLPGGCLAHPARGFSRRAVRAGGQWLPAAWGSKPALCLWPWASWGTCAGLGWVGTEQPTMMLQPSLLGPLSAVSCVSLSLFPPEHVGCGLPFLSPEILFSYPKSHNFRKEARSIFV